MTAAVLTATWNDSAAATEAVHVLADAGLGREVNFYPTMDELCTACADCKPDRHMVGTVTVFLPVKLDGGFCGGHADITPGAAVPAPAVAHLRRLPASPPRSRSELARDTNETTTSNTPWRHSGDDGLAEAVRWAPPSSAAD